MNIWVVVAGAGIGAAVTLWVLVAEHRQSERDAIPESDNAAASDGAQPRFRRAAELMHDPELGTQEIS